MPSHNTKVREAPLVPRPRREIPCVVGFEAMLEDLRKRLKPGNDRRRSSMLTPGVSSICCWSRTDMAVGVSAVTVSVTVIEVFMGSSFLFCGVAGCGVCASAGPIVRTNKSSAAPAQSNQALRAGSKQNWNAWLFIGFWHWHHRWFNIRQKL